MVATWIEADSLPAVLSYLSLLVGYEWCDDDLKAVLHGIKATNDEAGQWFTYPLVGERTIELRLARDAESSPVLHVRATVPPEIEGEVQTTLSIANCFILIDPGTRKV